MKGKDFLNQWNKEINDVKSILRYMHTYPSLLESIKMDDLLLPEELVQNQLSWMELVRNCSGMEKDFFKEHWVSIQRLQFQYFIDISDPNYPVLDFHFNSVEPYAYIRKNLFDSIGELMLLDEVSSDLDHFLSINRWELINSYIRNQITKQ